MDELLADVVIEAALTLVCDVIWYAAILTMFGVGLLVKIVYQLLGIRTVEKP